jgi:predicted transcriptional regulator
MASDHTLDDALEKRVRALADRRRQTPDRIVREAVLQYVEQQEARAETAAAAVAAWEDYRATGLNATGEEVDGWLRRLAEGEDADPPNCHR